MSNSKQRRSKSTEKTERRKTGFQKKLVENALTYNRIEHNDKHK